MYIVMNKYEILTTQAHRNFRYLDIYCFYAQHCQHNAMAENDHVIDIFTSEDMENISLYIFQDLTAYYIINIILLHRLLAFCFLLTW